MITASRRASRLGLSAGANSKVGWLFFLIPFAWLPGCSFVVDAEKTQCTRDADCQERFGDGSLWQCDHNVCVDKSSVLSPSSEPEEWACLEHTPEVSTDPGPFDVNLHIQNIANSTMPIVGARVDLCTKLDPACSTPEAMMLTNTNGDVTFSVRKGFSGFVAITKDGFQETDFHFPVSINKPETYTGIQLAPPSIVGALTGSLSLPPNPERGLILVSVYNCNNVGAAGVKLSAKEADAATRSFYAAGSLPSATLTETEVSGFGGFLNAPPGVFTIEAQRASDGRLLSRLAVSVKKNALTIARLFPMQL